MSEISTGDRHTPAYTKSASRGTWNLDGAFGSTGWASPTRATASPSSTARVVDQAALHGLLQKIRDTGLPLVSVTQVEPDQPGVPTTEPR